MNITRNLYTNLHCPPVRFKASSQVVKDNESDNVSINSEALSENIRFFLHPNLSFAERFKELVVPLNKFLAENKLGFRHFFKAKSQPTFENDPARQDRFNFLKKQDWSNFAATLRDTLNEKKGKSTYEAIKKTLAPKLKRQQESSTVLTEPSVNNTLTPQSVSSTSTLNNRNTSVSTSTSTAESLLSPDQYKEIKDRSMKLNEEGRHEEARSILEEAMPRIRTDDHLTKSIYCMNLANTFPKDIDQKLHWNRESYNAARQMDDKNKRIKQLNIAVPALVHSYCDKARVLIAEKEFDKAYTCLRDVYRDKQYQSYMGNTGANKLLHDFSKGCWEAADQAAKRKDFWDAYFFLEAAMSTPKRHQDTLADAKKQEIDSTQLYITKSKLLGCYLEHAQSLRNEKKWEDLTKLFDYMNLDHYFPKTVRNKANWKDNISELLKIEQEMKGAKNSSLNIRTPSYPKRTGASKLMSSWDVAQYLKQTDEALQNKKFRDAKSYLDKVEASVEDESYSHYPTQTQYYMYRSENLGRNVINNLDQAISLRKKALESALKIDPASVRDKKVDWVQGGLIRSYIEKINLLIKKNKLEEARVTFEEARSVKKLAKTEAERKQLAALQTVGVDTYIKISESAAQQKDYRKAFESLDRINKIPDLTESQTKALKHSSLYFYIGHLREAVSNKDWGMANQVNKTLYERQQDYKDVITPEQQKELEVQRGILESNRKGK